MNPLQDCPNIPLCVLRHQGKCSNPNPWIEFLAANPGRRSVQLSGDMAHRGALYRQLTNTARPVLVMPNVTKEDKEGLCTAYRQRAARPTLLISTSRSIRIPSLKYFPTSTRSLVNMVFNQQGQSQLPTHVTLKYNVRMEQIQHDTSLWRFRQRTWLSDDSIAYSVALWNKLFIATRILVFSSHFFVPGTNTSFLGTYSAQAKARLWNGLRTNSFNWPQDVPTEWILIPYNIGGTHWVLFAYNCALGFWYSFDSFNANHLSIIRTINTALNTSYPAVVKNQVLDEGHYVQAAVPLQSDGYSCGIWVIAYIACFALGKKLPRSAYDAPEAFADRYRKYILGCHLTNTVPHM